VPEIQADLDAGGRQFLDHLFLAASPAALATPVRMPPKAHNRSTLVEPTCKSLRQAAKRTAVPVAHRATLRLIHQLGLAR
jgi:hypothetical protein